MDYKILKGGDTVEVKMSGRFTFQDYDPFRQLRADLNDSGLKKLIVNLEGVEFMDSAGLSMLLLWGQDSTSHKFEIVLRNPKGMVDKLFQTTKVDSLFKIERG